MSRKVVLLVLIALIMSTGGCVRLDHSPLQFSAISYGGPENGTYEFIYKIRNGVLSHVTITDYDFQVAVEETSRRFLAPSTESADTELAGLALAPGESILVRAKFQPIDWEPSDSKDWMFSPDVSTEVKVQHITYRIIHSFPCGRPGVVIEDAPCEFTLASGREGS